MNVHHQTMTVIKIVLTVKVLIRAAVFKDIVQ